MRIRIVPEVSIIIVNWNGGEVFKNCLTSLSKLKYKNWELIVVDNGSSDGSEKLAKKIILPTTNYRLLVNKVNLGFAPANNQAIKFAKGDYVLLLNNDTVVSPDLLDQLVSRMEKDKKLGVIQPKIFMMDPPSPKPTDGQAPPSPIVTEGQGRISYLDNAGSFFTRIGFLEHWGFGQKDSKEFNKETKVFSCKGACMLVRKSVIDEIGLFDNDFVSYFEESDFCWRVWLAGWKVVYFPNATIEHKVGFTIKRLDVVKINYDYYKNRIMSLIKNLELINLIYILPIHLFISLGIAFVFFLRGQKNSAVMIIDAIGYNIRNIKVTLEKRKIIQQQRKVNDQFIFNNLSRKVDFNKFINDFRRVEKDME
ncbi:glycosyltransferase family 2 protein [Candidatus Woesebacteria bacterium]|nr:MAG: glycosyltransferase family 2 protein [Candidatus Woesebacteria bacterium]